MPKHERTRNGAIHTRFESSDYDSHASDAETASTSASTSPGTRVTRFMRKRAAKKIQRRTRKHLAKRKQEEDVCAICLENFRTDKGVKLTCGHHYHKICIDKWTTVSDKCPLCKRTISPALRAARPAIPAAVPQLTEVQRRNDFLERVVAGYLDREPVVREYENLSIRELLAALRDNFNAAYAAERAERTRIGYELIDIIRCMRSIHANVLIQADMPSIDRILRNFEGVTQVPDLGRVLVNYIRKHNRLMSHLSNERIMNKLMYDDIIKVPSSYIRDLI